MKNEILVTGATGFLGRHLVAALESQSYAVRKHSMPTEILRIARFPWRT